MKNRKSNLITCIVSFIGCGMYLAISFADIYDVMEMRLRFFLYGAIFGMHLFLGITYLVRFIKSKDSKESQETNAD